MPCIVCCNCRASLNCKNYFYHRIAMNGVRARETLSTRTAIKTFQQLEFRTVWHKKKEKNHSFSTKVIKLLRSNAVFCVLVIVSSRVTVILFFGTKSDRVWLTTSAETCSTSGVSFQFFFFFLDVRGFTSRSCDERIFLLVPIVLCSWFGQRKSDERKKQQGSNFFLFKSRYTHAQVNVDDFFCCPSF